MSQPNSNHAMIEILEDAEQVYNDVILLSAMDLSGNQRTKQMPNNHVNSSFSSKCSVEQKQPLRPLTGYTIFFQLQRERIVNHDESSTVKFNDQDIIGVIQERYNNWAGIVCHHGNNKYRNIKTKKNISFGELASKIAATWKKADPETKALMNFHAEKERKKYFKAKRETEASLNSPPFGLDSEQTSRHTTPIQISSNENVYRVQNTQATFPSFLLNDKPSLGYNIPYNSNNIYEDDWNCDLIPATNQQPNMVEMEQFLQCSKVASNDGLGGVNDTKLRSFQDTQHPIPDSEIESSYSRKKLMVAYLQQNLAYTEAQLKYNQHLQQLQIMYRQLQDTTSPMQYNDILPDHQLFKDEDYYLPLDDNEEDINTVDDMFIQPVERLYSDLNNKVVNTHYVTKTTDVNYESSMFTNQDNTFLQMEQQSFPNVFMNNMNGNVFDDVFDCDDFSTLF